MDNQVGGNKALVHNMLIKIRFFNPSLCLGKGSKQNKKWWILHLLWIIFLPLPLIHFGKNNKIHIKEFYHPPHPPPLRLSRRNFLTNEVI